MKKINYVEYFKVFENKKNKSIVISIGEFHEFYNCGDSEAALDVNNIIGDIFAFYKNTINNFIQRSFHPNFKRGFMNQIRRDVSRDDSVNVLVELDMTRCAGSYEPLNNVYDSNLFRVCDDFLKNKKKWKWIPIDRRSKIVFLPYLTKIINKIMKYKKYLTESKVYNIVEDFLMYKEEIDSFLESYPNDNFFKKQILLSYNKIKKIFKTCRDKTMLDIKTIGHLVGNIITAMQDIYCVDFIQNDKINIIYSGASHNRNIESFFRKNNYKVILKGKLNSINCTTIDLDLLNKILLNFYSNKILEIKNKLKSIYLR